MKKLHLKIGETFKPVFCYSNGKVITTDQLKQALPSQACWAKDDLAFFSVKFSDQEFALL